MSLFRKKDLSAMLAQADDGGKGLKRTLEALAVDEAAQRRVDGGDQHVDP